MTIRELVNKLYEENSGKSINVRTIRKFLVKNNIHLHEETIERVFDVYTRRIIDDHMRLGQERGGEDYNSYVEAKKDLDIFIGAISRNLEPDEIIELKQKINTLVDTSILWSHQ
jgi:hypothetical protein